MGSRGAAADGRVVWATCTQEWYRKASFDAKRRTQELRKLGFACAAQGVGTMPVLNGEGKVSAQKMTVVTIAAPNGETVPLPEMVEGLFVAPVSEKE